MANPNRIHRIIASWTDMHDALVYTTNFDTLIDDISINKANIIHVHGNVHNTSELIMRINQVGRGLNRVIKNDFVNSVKNKSLYVFGYSGNDKDIIDAINNSNPNKIIWIIKSDRDKYAIANVKQITCNCDCEIIAIDLNDIFDCLSLHYNMKIEKYDFDYFNTKASFLENWHKGIEMPEKLACLEKCFNLVGQHALSAEVCLNAIQNAYFKGTYSCSWFYNEAAAEKMIIGDFNKASEYIQKAIEIQTSPPHLFTLTLSYNMMGWLNVECDKPDYKKAIIYLKKADKSAKQYLSSIQDDKYLEGAYIIYGMIFNNLGLAYQGLKNHSKAIKSYKKSISYKRKAGDIIGTSMTTVNICIALCEANEHHKYYYWKSKALGIIEKYSLWRQKAFMFKEIGRIHCMKGKTRKGLEILEEALSLYRSMEDSNYDIAIINEFIQQYDNN